MVFDAIRLLIGMKMYLKVTLKIDKGKGGYIDEPKQVINMLQFCDDPSEYDVKEVWMWPWQHKRLPEFMGF